MGFSKAALADLVIDLLRQQHGDENLDGPALASAFVEAYRPIASARSERAPKVWEPKVATPCVGDPTCGHCYGRGFVGGPGGGKECSCTVYWKGGAAR